jgi:hypothetical protein
MSFGKIEAVTSPNRSSNEPEPITPEWSEAARKLLEDLELQKDRAKAKAAHMKEFAEAKVWRQKEAEYDVLELVCAYLGRFS